MGLSDHLASHVGLAAETDRRGESGLAVNVLESVTEANENQWNDLVSQSGMGTHFHRYEWLRAVEEGLSAEPRHLVVATGGNPVALLPTFRRELDLPVNSSLGGGWIRR